MSKSTAGTIAAAGALLSAVSWAGQAGVSAGTVAIFPDGLTVLAVLALIPAAVRYDARRRPVLELSFRHSLPVVTGIALVYAINGALEGWVRYSRPGPALLGATFLAAFLLSATLGAGSTLTWSGLRTRFVRA